VAAAGGPAATYHEGSIHPGRATAAEADLHLLLGLLDDVPVATAMAAVATDVVLVNGGATVAAVRGRGIGSVMTSAALGVVPDRPAVLGTSLLGRHVYEHLGFAEVAVPTWWTRGGAVNQR
jgi:GNAT superfamily N-acetyltransferase